MRLTRKQLGIIIERYLKEEEDWEKGWEDFDKDSDEDFVDNSFQKTLDELREKAINQILEELNSSNFSDQNIDKILLNVKIIPTIKNTKVISVESESEEFEGFKAIALSSHFSFEKDENKHVLFSDQIPEEFKSEIPKEILSNFEYDEDGKSKSADHPLIIFLKAYNNTSNEKEIYDILLHEMGHIKNSVIKSVTSVANKKFSGDFGPEEKLNIDVIKNILRKDLKNKSNEEFVQVFLDENRFDENTLRLRGEKVLIELKSYYDGTFASPFNEKSVDELAVRISALKRNKSAYDYMIDNPDFTYNDIVKKFNSDIADILILLDKNITFKDIEKIVKNNTIKSQSVIV